MRKTESLSTGRFATGRDFFVGFSAIAGGVFSSRLSHELDHHFPGFGIPANRVPSFADDFFRAFLGNAERARRVPHGRGTAVINPDRTMHELIIRGLSRRFALPRFCGAALSALRQARADMLSPGCHSEHSRSEGEEPAVATTPTDEDAPSLREYPMSRFFCETSDSTEADPSRILAARGYRPLASASLGFVVVSWIEIERAERLKSPHLAAETHFCALFRDPARSRAFLRTHRTALPEFSFALHTPL